MKRMKLIVTGPIFESELQAFVNRTDSGLAIEKNISKRNYREPYQSGVETVLAISAIIVNIGLLAKTLFEILQLMKKKKSKTDSEKLQLSVNINNKNYFFVNENEKQIRHILNKVLDEN